MGYFGCLFIRLVIVEFIWFTFFDCLFFEASAKICIVFIEILYEVGSRVFLVLGLGWFVVTRLA